MTSMADGDSPMHIVGMGFPTLTEIPPDINSPFLARRLGKRRLAIDTVGDLIEALAPYRDRRLFADAGLDDLAVVGDVVFVNDDELLLDLVPYPTTTDDTEGPEL